MSLLADLKSAAHLIDPQFQATSNEIPGVLAALVHYAQYGDKFLQAVEKGGEEVTQLLAPPAPKDAEQPAADAPPAAVPSDPAAPTADETALSDDQLAARIADLQALEASRHATAGQTTVEHETGAPAAPAAPATTTGTQGESLTGGSTWLGS